MYPNYYDEEEIYVHYTRKAKRFDVIVFSVNAKTLNVSNESNLYYIKRIIGMPGDSVVWQNKKLYINGEHVEESFYNDLYLERLDIYNDFDGTFEYYDIKTNEILTTTVIPIGYVFVLGDNRECSDSGVNYSHDSREIGLVPIDNIIGIVKS